MYTVQLRRRAQRALDGLPRRDFSAIVSALRGLEDVLRPKDVEEIKSAGLWRVRHGDYRIVYDIDDTARIVTILRIGHRREVYRSL